MNLSRSLSGSANKQGRHMLARVRCEQQQLHRSAGRFTADEGNPGTVQIFIDSGNGIAQPDEIVDFLPFPVELCKC